jgi:DNA-binding MarR family transcriptional regulator
VSLLSPAAGADPRLILSQDELDAAVEVFILAEAAFWRTADAGLEGESAGLGRSHYRAALLLRRRPGLGVQALTALTGLSKQGASRVMRDLIAAGYATSEAGDLDARRRPTRLTLAGEAFEGRVSERLREHLARAYRDGGLDAAPGARRILAAMAGPKASRRAEPGQ